MKETLGQKQRRFNRMFVRLCLHAELLGYEYREAFCLRCEDCPIGKKNSNHKKYLAKDLDLYKNEVYLSATEDHRQLGKYWESLAPDARWGGSWGDGNHYSLEHNGIK